MKSKKAKLATDNMAIMKKFTDFFANSRKISYILIIDVEGIIRKIRSACVIWHNTLSFTKEDR